MAIRHMAGLTVVVSALLFRPVATERGPVGAAPRDVRLYQSGQGVVSASSILQLVSAGEGVDLSDATVTGALDLRAVQTITRPFRCLSCTFVGSILASDVVFERVVDLSGAHIAGDLNLRGAVFEDSVLFRAAGESTAIVDGPANFTLASFGAPAGFDGAEFVGAADFGGARFLDDASFANTDFNADALFDQASFAGAALFSGSPKEPSSDASGAQPGCLSSIVGVFESRADFTRAAFQGPADFRQRCFAGDASLRDSSFAGDADFTLARFQGNVDFGAAGFQGRTKFQAAIFSAEAGFDRVAAGGPLDFEGAVFLRGASLAGLTGAGSVSLEGVLLAPDMHLNLDNLLADSFSMDVGSVTGVRGTFVQEHVLSLIEGTARARGDIALANDARFELLSLENRLSPPLHRVLDGFFYKTVAGYLVRPSHPLVTLVILVLVAAIIRSVPTWLSILVAWLGGWRTRSRGKPKDSLMRRSHVTVLGIHKAVASFLADLARTMGLALKRKPAPGEFSPQLAPAERELIRVYLIAGVRWVEFLTYKVLIVLFLLGLGNSNSTIRQIIDSVRG